MPVELRAVTIDNWRELIKLKVRDDQTGYVASNVFSIAEAQFGFDDEGHWNLHPHGVYDGDQAVGFLMYGLNPGHSRFQVFIARLMTDEQFQGRGYGRSVMEQIIGRFKGDESVRAVGISYEPHNEVAKKLYESLGFAGTGEMQDG